MAATNWHTRAYRITYRNALRHIATPIPGPVPIVRHSRLVDSQCYGTGLCRSEKKTVSLP